jgi:hypothetical protein
MKRTLLIATLIVAACAAAPAQDTRASGAASSRTTARAGDALQIDSDTRLAAQLQQTLDVRKAKVGDQVVLKTTEAIKSNGRTVVAKGARLVGRVTEVKARAQGASSSSIGLVFDRLESGALTTPITATITSITEAHAQAQMSDDDLGASASGSSSTRGGTSSGGGLLGGVSNTVGGVVDTTTNATGQVVGATTGAANGVGRTVSGLRITQSTSADAQGGSTLSLLGGNLLLEKNTTFHLVLNESAGVNNGKR